MSADPLGDPKWEPKGIANLFNLRILTFLKIAYKVEKYLTDQEVGRIYDW